MGFEEGSYGSRVIIICSSTKRKAE